MATTAQTLPQVKRPVGAYDRIFYSGLAVAMAAVVLIGFGPTYFLKLPGSDSMATISGRPFTPLVHLHGAIFTAWVLLFVVQTLLVARHRVAVHRRLGVAGGVLAALMVMVGVSAGIAAAARGAAPPGISPLQFLAIPLGDMLMFTIFVTAALYWRRDKELHKRLMVLAYVSIMAAPVARMPGVMPLGPLGFFGLAFVFALAGVAYDLVSRGRIHRAYLWGAPLLAASVPLRLMISGTEAWKAFAQAITS
ncbi:MAG TPA: hypothetical protein VMZ25_07140 [Terriglobales bacterium]|nr:hypothetical protein [Terriglobales bacterium]